MGIGKVSQRLKNIIVQFIEECSAEFIETEVMPDHVHSAFINLSGNTLPLRGGYPRSFLTDFAYGISVVKEKTTYSLDKQLFRQYRVPALAKLKKGVGVPLEVIKKYVEQQKGV